MALCVEFHEYLIVHSCIFKYAVLVLFWGRPRQGRGLGWTLLLLSNLQDACQRATRTVVLFLRPKHHRVETQVPNKHRSITVQCKSLGHTAGGFLPRSYAGSYHRDDKTYCFCACVESMAVAEQLLEGFNDSVRCLASVQV